MNEDELEIEIKKWKDSIVNVVSDMSNIKTSNHLLLEGFDHKPIVDSFDAVFDEVREKLECANRNSDKMTPGFRGYYNGSR